MKLCIYIIYSNIHISYIYLQLAKSYLGMLKKGHRQISPKSMLVKPDRSWATHPERPWPCLSRRHGSAWMVYE